MSRAEVVVDTTPRCTWGWPGKCPDDYWREAHYCCRRLPDGEQGPDHTGRCRCTCGATTRATHAEGVDA